MVSWFLGKTAVGAEKGAAPTPQCKPSIESVWRSGLLVCSQRGRLSPPIHPIRSHFCQPNCFYFPAAPSQGARRLGQELLHAGIPLPASLARKGDHRPEGDEFPRVESTNGASDSERSEECNEQGSRMLNRHLLG